jgi:hypothetical protein
VAPLGVGPDQRGVAVDVEPGAEEAVEEEEGGGPPVGEVLPGRGPRGRGMGEEDIYPVARYKKSP